MSRRTLIKTRPISETKIPGVASMAGEAHLHFCKDRECRQVYEDACKTPQVNGLCHEHRGSRRPAWAVARDPQECCLGNCTQVIDKAERKLYNLAGPGPWYRCRACSRVHGWPCS